MVIEQYPDLPEKLKQLFPVAVIRMAPFTREYISAGCDRMSENEMEALVQELGEKSNVLERSGIVMARANEALWRQDQNNPDLI